MDYCNNTNNQVLSMRQDEVAVTTIAWLAPIEQGSKLSVTDRTAFNELWSCNAVAFHFAASFIIRPHLCLFSLYATFYT